MNVPYYHTPPRPVSTRVHCPVCHEPVYSRGDIHPQCAVSQSDQIERIALKLAQPSGTGVIGCPPGSVA
jgi:hypothetical protein